MAAKVQRVRPREITGLLRELRRLVELGNGASYGEWLAYHERKAELLARIAARPGELVDVDEAVEVAVEAQQRVEALQAQFGGER